MSFPALRTVALMKNFPLDHSCRLVLFALANNHNRFSGNCYPAHSTIADDAGLSRNSVPRAIKLLVDAGYLKVIDQGGISSKAGSRKTDSYVFLFPLVKATGEDDPPMVEITTPSVGPTADDVGPTVDSVGPVVGTKPDINQETNQDSLVLETEDDTMVDFKAATELLWQMASDTGRKRSSKGDIEVALKAAIKRGQTMERIMKGMGAYFRSQEATKDDGEFQAGIHRKIQNDRWAGFLDDEQARVDKGEQVTEELQKARELAGTAEAPSEARQNLWMELFSQGMTWDSERGPQPGRLGCRVREDIQRKWGTEPFQAPNIDADAAAFD